MRGQLESMVLATNVVKHPTLFKAQLGVGGDAYTSLWLGKKIRSAFEMTGAAAAGGSAASTGLVASTFFSSGSWLTALGLGGAAVTPVGWVIAASVATAGTYVGISRLIKDAAKDSVQEVPTFISTPLDVLAVSLFDLMAPLAFKIASSDGLISEDEIEEISAYFVEDWGYDRTYVDQASPILMNNSADVRLDALARALRQFKIDNPDCNHDYIRRKFVGFLKDIAMSDGEVSETEEMAIERVERLLSSSGKFSFTALIRKR